MKFGKIVAGAILAVSAVSASAADKEGVFELELFDGAGGYSQVWSFAGAAGKTFADTWTFTIDESLDLGASLTSVANKKFNLDITSYDLYFGNTLVASGVESFSGTTENWDLKTGYLAAGDYSLKIAGVFEGTNGGSYGGTLAVSPVPEPATWGMIGLGLVAVGAMSRRKQAK